MKKTFLLAVSVLISSVLWSKDYSVKSPDGKINLTVSVGSGLKWSVTYDAVQVIRSSGMGLELKSGKILGENERVKKVDNRKLDETLYPVVSSKRAEIRNQCNILEITFKSGFVIVFRAYDDGIAYRFESDIKDDLIIRNEIADFEFPRETSSWYPLEEGFFSANERTYIFSSLDTIGKDHLASLPALFKSEGINILLTEADLEDYPGMWLVGQGSRKISGTWPKYPDKETFRNEDMIVSETKGYIAQTNGKRTFPWRVFIISPTDAGLTGSDMVYRFALPSRIKETGWIKPGQVACDLWNENNIFNVNFRAGINNETYRYYIDFASANGLEYIILDKGWYEKGNVTDEIEGINVYDLCEYGKSKDVGVLLGVTWKSFWDKMDEAIALYEKWGVKGIKIDLMQRDDQRMVNAYYDAAGKAADHHLVIDFHGGSIPDGLNNLWPNVLTYEGVKGLEKSKQNREVDPEHDVTIPYIRMVNGPMDYCPGSVINMDKASFSPKNTRPESQGTRAHQVAMYIVYESPLQMLADSPANYMREQETTDFIRNIPVVWDDIASLDGKVGDFILLARKSGNEWFVGAMTDWNERTIDIDFSFLQEGQYKMEVFQDGINADRNASDYEIVHTEMRAGGRTRIHMAPGGGWAARLTPIF